MRDDVPCQMDVALKAKAHQDEIEETHDNEINRHVSEFLAGEDTGLLNHELTMEWEIDNHLNALIETARVMNKWSHLGDWIADALEDHATDYLEQHPDWVQDSLTARGGPDV